MEHPIEQPILGGKPLDLDCTEGEFLRSYRRGYWLVKRVMDIAVCSLTLLFIWPMVAAILVLIHLDSSGPALFLQERVGRGGCRFGMFKFRTMVHNAEDPDHKARMRAYVDGGAEDETTATHKPFPPSRVTRVGRLLRKTSLDELPQILNVLKGDMSLVGPRPNVPWEVEAYKPWHLRRLDVLPGITGLAQVRGRSDITFDRIVQYDIEYIETQSPLLDLKILLWTIPLVLSGQGAG